MAVANYHDAKGQFPPPYLTNPEGQPIHTWRVLILPYIEQNDLYQQYQFDEPFDGPNNKMLASRMPRMYSLHCEYKRGAIIANYLAIVGPNTVWRPGKATKQGDLLDGMSNILLIPENFGMNIEWMEPRDFDFETMDWIIDSPNGVSSRYVRPGVVMLDGSVRTLSKRITPDALRALVTINGGEQLSGDLELLPEMRDGRDRPVTKP